MTLDPNEDRLAKLEANVAALQTDVDNDANNVVNLTKRVDALETSPALDGLKRAWAKIKPWLATLLPYAVIAFLVLGNAKGCESGISCDPRDWFPPTPGPGPEPGPAPIPQTGLRVLIVEETAERTAATSAIIGSTAIRSYVAEKCAKGPDGKTPEFRIYDKDVTGESAVWQEAMKLPRQSLPWLIVSNGKQGYEGPLPKTPAETLTLLKKFGN